MKFTDNTTPAILCFISSFVALINYITYSDEGFLGFVIFLTLSGIVILMLNKKGW
jgi:hypothetical protein